jgi:tetratricopeptide (TPR) repeat protein
VLAESFDSGQPSGTSPDESVVEPVESIEGSAHGGAGNAAITGPEPLWAAGHYTACERKLKKERSPLPAARALLLAQCSFYSGDYQGSLAASEAVLKTDAQSGAGLYWKAKSAKELAVYALGQMRVVAPGSAKVHLLLAELLLARESFGSAEAEYKEAIQAGPDDPEAHLGLAHLYFTEFHDDKARDELQAVLGKAPQDPEANSLWGEILVREQQSPFNRRLFLFLKSTIFWLAAMRRRANIYKHCRN